MSKQDVLRLEIAVNDALALKQTQRAEHLLRETSDERKGEAFEFVRLDELVQVHAQQFGRDAEMAAEIEALREVDHAVLVLGVLQTPISVRIMRSDRAPLTHSRSFCKILTSTKAC